MSTDISEARRKAGRVAGSAQLLDIRATQIAGELHDGTSNGPYQVEIKLHPTFQTDRFGDNGGWLLLYNVGYDVDVMAEDGTSVANASCRLNCAYEWPKVDRPDDDEIESFGETTVLLALYPYLRELVHSVTSRFGLGQLVMPLYREPLRVPEPSAAPSAKKAAKKITAKRQSKTVVAKGAARKKAPPKKAAAARKK